MHGMESGFRGDDPSFVYSEDARGFLCHVVKVFISSGWLNGRILVLVGNIRVLRYY